MTLSGATAVDPKEKKVQLQSEANFTELNARAVCACMQHHRCILVVYRNSASRPSIVGLTLARHYFRFTKYEKEGITVSRLITVTPIRVINWYGSDRPEAANGLVRSEGRSQQPPSRSARPIRRSFV